MNLKPKRYLTKRSLRVIIIAVLFLIPLMGCTSVRMTTTPRSMLEEKLLVHGLERALAVIDLEPIKGKSVALETAGLTKDDLPFAESYIRFWLLKNEVRIVHDPGESEINLKVLLTVLAVDQSETLLGTPQMIVLGVPIPAVAIYRNLRNRGRTEILMYALDRDSKTLVHEFNMGIGEARYDRYTILFIINWTSTDLDLQPSSQIPIQGPLKAIPMGSSP